MFCYLDTQGPTTPGYTRSPPSMDSPLSQSTSQSQSPPYPRGARDRQRTKDRQGKKIGHRNKGQGSKGGHRIPWKNNLLGFWGVNFLLKLFPRLRKREIYLSFRSLPMIICNPLLRSWKISKVQILHLSILKKVILLKIKEMQSEINRVITDKKINMILMCNYRILAKI